MDYVILSNNSCLEDTVSGIVVTHIHGGLTDIYAAIELALQNGHELISSPLPPNVPLIRSPIRSVILRKAERKYDASGLLTLEKAKERSNVLGIREDPGIMKDLAFIDRDHLLRAISQLGELEGGR